MLGSLKEGLRTIVGAVLIALFLRSFGYEPFNIPSESMLPRLLVGDYLFVAKWPYGYSRYSFPMGPPIFEGRIAGSAPERGDIAVFKTPSDNRTDFIKRVIGLPGDTISVRADHLVYVNGQPLLEDYIAAAPRNVYPLGGGEYTVPPGMIFVLGDNRNNSQDSRSFSAVPLDNVIGKAVIAYWPMEAFGLIPHERYALATETP